MDLGVEVSVRLHTDATTGRAIATRKGLGKVRHIAVNELWLQAQVAERKVSIHKIKNKFNLADLQTKYLTAAEIEHIIDFMQHSFLEGRHELAPALSLLDDNPAAHDAELHKTSKDGRQECWCRGICTPQ